MKRFQSALSAMRSFTPLFKINSIKHFKSITLRKKRFTSTLIRESILVKSNGSLSRRKRRKQKIVLTSSYKRNKRHLKKKRQLPKGKSQNLCSQKVAGFQCKSA